MTDFKFKNDILCSSSSFASVKNEIFCSSPASKKPTDNKIGRLKVSTNRQKAQESEEYQKESCSYVGGVKLSKVAASLSERSNIIVIVPEFGFPVLDFFQ